MDFWQCVHPHEFTFEAPRPGRRRGGPLRDVVLRIGKSEDGDDWSMLEQNLPLKEVFGAEGRLRSTVAPHGEVLPLYYLYDLGVRSNVLSRTLFG